MQQSWTIAILTCASALHPAHADRIESVSDPIPATIVAHIEIHEIIEEGVCHENCTWMYMYADCDVVEWSSESLPIGSTRLVVYKTRSVQTPALRRAQLALSPNMRPLTGQNPRARSKDRHWIVTGRLRSQADDVHPYYLEVDAISLFSARRWRKALKRYKTNRQGEATVDLEWERPRGGLLPN